MALALLLQRSSNKAFPSSVFTLPKLVMITPTTLTKDIHTSTVLDRARVMTRLRKRKIVLDNIKKKAERLRKNPPPIPKKLEMMLKAKGLWGNKDLREKDDKPIPIDNVFSLHDHTWPRYSPEEAIQNLREHYQPSMLDDPQAIIKAKVEFNMTGSKATKFLDGFSRMVPIYHKYDEEIPSKSVCVFVSTDDEKKKAIDAGATLAGGDLFIADILKGRIDVADMDYFLAHEDMLLNLKPITGLIREKMPRKQDGTLGTDLEYMIKTFCDGQKVEVKKCVPSLTVADEPDYGYCVVEFGRLDMDTNKLIENVNGILLALSEKNLLTRVSRNDFITRCQFYVDEQIPVKFSIYHDLIKDVKGSKYLEREQATN